MGNPDNAPDLPIEDVENDEDSMKKNEMKLRVHLEKKGRGGKPTSIVRGWYGSKVLLQELGKEIKIKCGVGGSVKDNEIIIQGNQRDKILDFLISKGYTQTKKAGG